LRRLDNRELKNYEMALSCRLILSFVMGASPCFPPGMTRPLDNSKR